MNKKDIILKTAKYYRNAKELQEMLNKVEFDENDYDKVQKIRDAQKENWSKFIFYKEMSERMDKDK